MSEFFQVRKNTTLFPKGRNQIVMVLFLIWLLRGQIYLCADYHCSYRHFSPCSPKSTLEDGHPACGHSAVGSLPVGEDQRRWHLLLSYQDNTVWAHPPSLKRSHLPCAIHPALHRGCRSRFSAVPWLPQADLRVPGSPGHQQATVAAQRKLRNMPAQTCCSLRPARSLGVGGLLDARWLWAVRSSSDPPKPREMQYLAQICLRTGFSSWSNRGSRDGQVPSPFP